MNTAKSCPVLVGLFLSLQVMGPAILWAEDVQRGIRVERDDRGRIAGLTGSATAAPLNVGKGERLLRFRDEVESGEQIATNPSSTAELLLGNRALISLSEQSRLRVTQESGQTVLELSNGTARLATAASALQPDETIAVRTPMATVTSRGGVLRVTVQPPTGQAALASLHRVTPLMPGIATKAALSANAACQECPRLVASFWPYYSSNCACR